GTIATERDGEDGFGYDHVFIAAETGRTFASMDADAKNAISHRGRAMRKLADRLAAL
ncbi:MAG: non-canonical purine NTP pyrophosphatase, partial [Muribaculaceae bacterium]|nr:non-canonical purine NTP pyrophosphatase [Muribaculaceae bacterium]